MTSVPCPAARKILFLARCSAPPRRRSRRLASATAAPSPSTPPPTRLLDLPSELLVRALSHCGPADIARVAAVSLLFHAYYYPAAPARSRRRPRAPQRTARPRSSAPRPAARSARGGRGARQAGLASQAAARRQATGRLHAAYLPPRFRLLPAGDLATCQSPPPGYPDLNKA